MIDLTPLDVRKKKGDFRRAVRGYDTELVDDFLDMVAERLEELVKQNVALTERSEHLQEQLASYREREKALNEALVTAQQLRAEARTQADREADLVRREANSQAERILEEGQRSFRGLQREIEGLHTRRRQFVRSFRTLLERYVSELEVEEARLTELGSDAVSMKAPLPMQPEAPAPESADPKAAAETDETVEESEPGSATEREWLSSLVNEGEPEEKES